MGPVNRDGLKSPAIMDALGSKSHCSSLDPSSLLALLARFSSTSSALPRHHGPRSRVSGKETGAEFLIISKVRGSKTDLLTWIARLWGGRAMTICFVLVVLTFPCGE